MRANVWSVGRTFRSMMGLDGWRPLPPHPLLTSKLLASEASCLKPEVCAYRQERRRRRRRRRVSARRSAGGELTGGKAAGRPASGLQPIAGCQSACSALAISHDPDSPVARLGTILPVLISECECVPVCDTRISALALVFCCTLCLTRFPCDM